ncbi:11-beta-hydroxysteroid dehydrogenase A [Sesamum indicum]|uniref:11-beta-hydroxysteroid dehydrogenase A n=1 Tax=Sesamum indicum TaxID=4182 RepID=HSDA_SESIN|nr:11-beta-hydroxysteroid dehydrogenase A [Sesamum indicum]Q93W57.1 RecName: Full=11-beta-hydroxysteroid dehydrogenase A; AltName: Full=17-beta-hydroxysteroid dehydrogenase A; AltName: Full=Seed oil body protein 2; AltName: Full=Steroleosin-A [Sesamum indicum]AAL09328.1 steroleosin [Sesamum indicum]AAL13315.1 steroleosin [Sesamum indicum]
MDLIHTFLNLIAPPFTFFFLLFFLPPFQIFKFFLSILGTLFSEDVAGKVVVITGASSGIGESLAYEYAKRGACLVLAARRERSLQEVAERARDLGSPDVVVVRADVSKAEDCRKVVDQTMNRFGRLDHLVNNAGIMSVSMLEEVEDITGYRETMDINFWGYVYMTRFAAPYLRNSRGRIVVLSSSSSWMPTPRMSFYNASKAAISQFFETLRVEFGPDIGITLVTPGFIESELTQGKFYNAGERVIDQDMRDVQVSTTPILRVESAARSIVRSAIRGERYVTEPAWFRVTYWWKLFCPEVMEWVFRLMYLASPGEPEKETFGKKVLDYTGVKSLLYPETVQVPEPKND